MGGRGRRLNRTRTSDTRRLELGSSRRVAFRVAALGPPLVRCDGLYRAQEMDIA